MSRTEDKSTVDLNKIVIFGAGKIGRSFIGQLFGRSGYKIVFIDIDPCLISLLNKHAGYRVVIKGEKEEEILITNVKAVSALDKSAVARESATAGIIAVSVGKNALEKAIPAIATGLEIRYHNNPDKPLDIILAENMRSAADFTREQLAMNLPHDFPLDQYVGLIETSIGKMVPIMPLAALEKDPLVVYAEPYNTLILDRKGFKSHVPAVDGLSPKNNIKAWVDRKAFIHNLGHATAAYYGFFEHPESVFMYEVLEDEKVYGFTRKVMMQSAEILRIVYPDDFTIQDLEEHIDDLLFRFRNKALQDTIFRVGQDLPRKLGIDDRFMGAIYMAQMNGMPCDLIIRAMSYGFFFRARDEEGKLFYADEVFLEAISIDLELILIRDLAFDPDSDKETIRLLNQNYKQLSGQHSI